MIDAASYADFQSACLALTLVPGPAPGLRLAKQGR